MQTATPEETLLTSWESELYQRLLDHKKVDGAEMIKVIDLLASLIRQDEARLSDLGTQVTEAYLENASSEAVWSSFEAEVITPAQDSFKALIEQLRKRYCILCSSLINRQTRRYFKSLTSM